MGSALLLVLIGAVVAGVVVAGDAGVRRRVREAAVATQRQFGEQAASRLPASWRRGLAGRLVAAGVDPGAGVPTAVGLAMASTAAALVVVGVAVAVAPGAPWLVVGIGAGVAVAAAPEIALRRRVLRRGAAMGRDLPRMLDLLVISVEAGLGLDQALARVVAAVPGELADEFARLLAEVGAGVPRSEALGGLAARCPVPELRSFALAMVQADAYGVAVGPLLRAQADEIRTRRRQRVQMLAQKAPVKLLVPMVLCIFPALLVVVAGPALLSVRSLLGR